MPEALADISICKNLIKEKPDILDFNNLEIASFFGKLVFEEDLAKIKEFYDKLNNKSQAYFYNQSYCYLEHIKYKFRYAGFIPQQITDAQNRLDVILKELNLNIIKPRLIYYL